MPKAKELNIICKWIMIICSSYANIPSHLNKILIINKRIK